MEFRLEMEEEDAPVPFLATNRVSLTLLAR